MRRCASFFNPKRYRIVLFDQRGCGKSQPVREPRRQHHLAPGLRHRGASANISKIERWQVFGGSWGSTLALAYAQKHPERVHRAGVARHLPGATLRTRVVLPEPESARRRCFPDLWEHYLAPLSDEERKDCMRSYYKRLTSDDRKRCSKRARAWSIWESALSYMKLNTELRQAAPVTRIRRRVCAHRVSLLHERRLPRAAESQLLDDVPQDPPHSRGHRAGTLRRRLCPMRSAWDLHKAWPEADLRIVPDAGHSAFEASTARELIAATDRFCAPTLKRPTSFAGFCRV